MKNILCLFFLLLNVFVSAQERFKMSVKNSPQGSVRVFEVTRKSETIGNVLSTTVEFMFENQTERVLEADFEFALEEGESVVSYSLDINGKMRKGVVVEKEKAREVFESEVRKGIDPGFVEKTVGNNFKTRVYPILPHGIRKIEITYEKIVNNVNKNTFIQTIGKDTYFYFSDLIDFDKKTKNSSISKLTVLFDVSSSAKNRDIQKEIEFLKKYSEKLNNPQIKVVTFSNKIIETFDIKNDFEKLNNLVFDGATNLDIDFSKYDGNVLLFSDGIANWKESDVNSKSNCKISTINTALISNTLNLRKIANEHFGTFINLRQMSCEKAIEKMFENPLHILNIEYDSNVICDVFPKVNSIVDENFCVSGILKKKSGNIKISLGRFDENGGKVEKVIEKTISSINNSDNIESEKVARLWAIQKINELEIDKDYNRKEIIEIAKKFSVVTEETSLIVLETAQQYAQHSIVPPEELRAEYEKILTQLNRNKINSDSTNIIPQFVYNNFEEFKKWWNKTPKDFEKEQNIQKKATASRQMTDRVDSLRFEAQNSDVFVEFSRAMEVEENVAPMMVNERMALKNSVDSIQNTNSLPNANSISLKEWSSNANYISILKKTPTEKMYEKYIELKKEYESSPSFYIEVSDYFIEENLNEESIRILSNLAEMNLENSDVLRALGNKLIERKEYKLAIPIFEKLTKIKSEIPQFYRDLALACNLAGEKQKAIENLWYVASKDWNFRFNEIQQVCLNDMNAIISSNPKLDTSKFDSKLMQNFDEDIRIVLTWNTDDCDIDLWVTDPNNEKCFYSHKYTKIGGRMSRDFTQGYGPEEFCIRNAKKGSYKIEANYYGSRQQKLLQPVIVQAEVYTNFGRKNQKREVLTLQLENIKGTFEIGEVNF